MDYLEFIQPVVKTFCVVCGEVAKEEPFNGNIDIMVCDRCRRAIMCMRKMFDALIEEKREDVS